MSLSEELLNSAAFDRAFANAFGFAPPKLNNNLTKTMEGTKLKCETVSRSMSYGNARTFSYRVDGEQYIYLNQIPFPNCCGITIFKDVSIYDQTTKEQFISALDRIIATLKKEDSYSRILFYTNQGSYPAKMFALYPGILILDSFINKRSGNVLIGFEIDLLERTSSIGTFDRLDIPADSDESDFDIFEAETQAQAEADRFVSAHRLQSTIQPYVVFPRSADRNTVIPDDDIF